MMALIRDEPVRMGTGSHIFFSRQDRFHALINALLNERNWNFLNLAYTNLNDISHLISLRTVLIFSMSTYKNSRDFVYSSVVNNTLRRFLGVK